MRLHLLFLMILALLCLVWMLVGYGNVLKYDAQPCVANVTTPIKPTVSSQDEVMLEEAYVSYCTCGRYEPLVQILLESLHEFSTRPVLMYWVGCTPKFDLTQYPRLINKYIISSPMGDAFAKLRVILLAKVKYAVYIDVDNVVNRRVDDLFEMCRENAHLYPLLPRHAVDPNDQTPSMERLGVKSKSMPYVHASTFMYTYESMPFFMEVYELVLIGKFAGQQYTDETAINVMLWKHNISDHACMYDMYFWNAPNIYVSQADPEYKDYFALGTMGNDTPLAILTNHGEKDPEKARASYDLFKKHRNLKPYYNGSVWSEDWRVGARGCLCGAERRCDSYKGKSH